MTPGKKGTSARGLFDADYSTLAPRFKLVDEVGELSDTVDYDVERESGGGRGRRRLYINGGILTLTE